MKHDRGILKYNYDSKNIFKKLFTFNLVQKVYRYANYEETMNAFPDSVIRWREIIDENGEKKVQKKKFI